MDVQAALSMATKSRRCIATQLSAASAGRQRIMFEEAENYSECIGCIMDDIDFRLLSLLRKDARLPLKALASDVGLAVSSVQGRIRRLIDAGVITGFTVMSDFDVGTSAILMIELVITPSPEVVRAISDRAEVVRCYSLSGAIDLLVELNCQDVGRINAVRDEIAMLQGVKGLTTSFILKRDKA
jgi:DNA-binding Lrp family transcriptional regulator